MRICMVFPKTTMFENPMVYPPLGLFIIKSVLQQHGHQIDYFDMSEASDNESGQKVKLYDSCLNFLSNKGCQIIRIANIDDLFLLF